MRSYVPVLLTLVVSLAAIGCPTTATAAVDPEQRITLHVENLPLRDALAQVAREHGAEVQVAPDVPNLPVSLDVQNQPLRQVVWMLAVRETQNRFMGIHYALKDRVFRVWVDPVEEQDLQRFVPTPPDTRLSGKITLTLKQTPLRQALATLFRDVPCGYVIESAVPDVPLDLSTGETTVFEALQQLLRAARQQVPDLEVSRGYGVYRFIVRDTRRRRITDIISPRKLTLHLQAVPLRHAVDILMAGSGLQYAIDPDVSTVRVNLDVSDVTVEQALNALVHAANPRVPDLRLVNTQGVFLLTTRPPGQ